VWERVPDAGPSEVLEFNDDQGRPALQLSLGPWLMFVRPRAVALSQASGLTDCLAAVDAAERAALLDFEISFGRRQRSGGTWRIELSTLPWLEGSERQRHLGRH